MKRRTRFLLGAIAVAMAVASFAWADAAVADRPADAGPPPDRPHKKVCQPGNSPKKTHCHAEVVTEDDEVTPFATTSPSAGALTPADIQSAYGIPGAAAGAGQTIAIVVAYDSPNAESDLGQYRSRFGLSPCTTANGCFRKVNQNGVQGSYPTPDVNWAQEAQLDLDMASAACPSCKLLLVVANSNFFTDIVTAVDRAALMGANAISNSYGAREFNGETAFEPSYNHPGIAITVSSGDSGYVAEFPAASRYVTAVGGTTLSRSNNSRGWSETTWNGAGSGCSAYITKPTWQTDTGCPRRTIADVSAVADPRTGVAVYSSYGSSGGANWYIYGGTSASAPIVAGIYAAAGRTGSLNYGSEPYNNPGALNDVTSGSNGWCSPAYLCSARAGYDGPTGLGTPMGLGAFGGQGGTPSPTTTTTLAPTTTTTSTTRPPTTTTTSPPPTTTTTTVGAKPSAPTNPRAMQSASPGVLVVWYPPSSNGCSGVTSFRIYRATSSGTETFLVSVTGYQYQDTSAVAGVRYYYQVSAVNACGEGPRSVEVTAVAR